MVFVSLHLIATGAAAERPASTFARQAKGVFLGKFVATIAMGLPWSPERSPLGDGVRSVVLFGA